MNVRQLEYFIAVAETLNFTKAAARFFISQTAVTQQIKALEQEINITLFERSKRHVELTPAGQVFLPEAKEIIAHLRSAIDRCAAISAGINGTLSLGIVRDFIDVSFVDKLSLYCKKFPNIDIRFRRSTVSDLYDSLLNGKTDLIINVKFHIEKYPHIRYQLQQRSPLLAILPAAHPLARKTQLSLKDLQEELLLLLDPQGNNLDEKIIMLQNISSGGYIPKKIRYMEDVETILLMAAAHQGVGLIPAYTPLLLQQFSGKVRALPLIDNEHRIEIISAWDTTNTNPALAHFLRIL